jgi:hypothetical protein
MLDLNRQTCIHEAAHAVYAVRHKIVLEWVSIDKEFLATKGCGPGVLGRTLTIGANTKSLATRMGMYCIGAFTEFELLPDSSKSRAVFDEIRTASDSDWNNVEQLATALQCSIPSVQEYCQSVIYKRLAGFVAINKDAIYTVARTLSEKKTLTGDEVIALIGQAQPYGMWSQGNQDF